MDNIEQLVDINQAALEELCLLPGVGVVLAERIIAARPFVNLEDLSRVRGITQSLVEKWRPFLAVSQTDLPDQIESETIIEDESLPQSDPSLPENTPEKETLSEEDSPEQQQILDENQLVEEEPQSEPPQPFPPNLEPPENIRRMAAELPQQFRTRLKESAPLGRAEALLWGGGLALLVLILSVAIGLGLLAGINGGLSFAPYNKYIELQNQVTTVDTRLKQLQQDTTSLQERMNALEGLSARMGVLENDSAALKEQLAGQTAEIQKLNEQNNQIKTQMSRIDEDNKRFKQFFDGLKGLVENIFKDTQK